MPNYAFETQLLYHSQAEVGDTLPTLSMSNGFAYETSEELEDAFMGRTFGYTYTRKQNPTTLALEKKVTELDSGIGAVVTASGLSCLALIIESLAESGDHIVSSTHIFGGSYSLFLEICQQQQIEVSFIDTDDVEMLKNALKPNTKAVFCESIGNPKSDVAPLKEMVAVCKQARVPFVLDNTVPTPYCLDAKSLGVDIVWYSLSKWYAGMGMAIGGAVIDLGHYDWTQSQSKLVYSLKKPFGNMAFLARLRQLLNFKGGCLSPFNAWMMLQNMQTLSVRMKKHCENAQKLASFLEEEPKVKHVFYPSVQQKNLDVFKSCDYGGLMAFELSSKEACYLFTNQLRLIKKLANLGDVKTIMISPDSTICRNVDAKMKQRMGVSPELIRVSVGIEAFEDIKADIQHALKGVN